MIGSQFGELVKAVVDVKQGIMAVGGELHADEEVILFESKGSRRGDLWGINLYPLRADREWIEFDSIINIKPQLNNRSRSVEDEGTRKKIQEIVKKLVSE